MIKIGRDRFTPPARGHRAREEGFEIVNVVEDNHTHKFWRQPKWSPLSFSEDYSPGEGVFFSDGVEEEGVNSNTGHLG